eukprot:gene28889-34863_t
MICITILQYDYEVRSFNSIAGTRLSEEVEVDWDCSRPWPSHAMFLTLYVAPKGSQVENRHKWESGELPEWYDIFLRGALLFWPWKIAQTPLIIAIDAEMKGTQELNEQVLDLIDVGRKDFADLYPNISVVYNDPLNNTYRNGYGRMQYLGFVADKEDLWEDGKPIISGRLSHTNWEGFYKKTYDALGIEEIMCCMSYFPVVIKRSHLASVREAIRVHRNKSTFEEAYYDYTFFYPGAQYNIMCTWLFLNKRDEYAWRLKDLEPEWDGFHNPTPKPGMWGDKSIFKPEEIQFSVPYLSDHLTYGMLRHKNGSYTAGLLAGRFGSKFTHQVLKTNLLTSLCYLETHKPHTFLVASNATELGRSPLLVVTQFSLICLLKCFVHQFALSVTVVMSSDGDLKLLA